MKVTFTLQDKEFAFAEGNDNLFSTKWKQIIHYDRETDFFKSQYNLFEYPKNFPPRFVD